ncbi:MAG: TonB family protein [Fibromonadaceae bacterium]|jgi:TonB family protein|nr:TonB family protein [Fibromonadaceae bacterium]
MNICSKIKIIGNIFLVLLFFSLFACDDKPAKNPQTVTSESKPTEALIVTSTFTDSRDGKSYKTVKIGEQTWMAENLAFNASGSKCYKNDESNCEKYGRLYDWNTARNVCPMNWRLPTNTDWQELVLALDGSMTVAGVNLKARSGWNDDGNGADTYGFSALPGGYALPALSELGTLDRFSNAGSSSRWWSATKGNIRQLNTYLQLTSADNNFEYKLDITESLLLSVRCVKEVLKTPTVADINLSNKSRSKEEVIAVVNARAQGLKTTYNKYAKNKDFSGKVTLRFTIASSGDVTDISIVSSTTEYPEFDIATMDMVKTWKWKTKEGDNTVATIPFSFAE